MSVADRQVSIKAEKSLFSENYVPQTMPRILGTFDMTATFVIAIYALSSAPTAVSGGAASFLYWLIGGVAFFVPCSIVAAQLGVMYPHEGSLYHWTHKALGGFWSFFVGLCSWLPAPLVIVGLGVEFVSFVQGLNPNWLVEPIQQGVVILVIIVLSAVISLQRLQTIQRLTNIIFILSMIATALIGIAGVVWLLQGHAAAINFSQVFKPGTLNANNYSLYGLILFAYIGSNMVLNMSGEVKEQKAIPRHLLWGSLIVFASYITATTGILIVQGDKAGFVNFSMVSTIDAAFHTKILGSICTIFFLSSIIAAAAAYNYIHARLLMVGGIDRRLPTGIRKLNKNRAPVNAVIFQTIVAIVFTILVFMVAPYALPFAKPADLNAEVYFVSQAAATLVWIVAVLFLFINLIALYQKDRRAFEQKRIFPMWILWLCVGVGSLSIIVAIANTLMYSWIPQIANTYWWLFAGGVTAILIVAATLTSFFATSEAEWQQFSE